ncbi:MAG TPA: hypothetical protein VN953_10825, partial [Gemmatimonadales bacterium]|nr:hypothetical protein [Gemmatimonadales bacterium]
ADSFRSFVLLRDELGNPLATPVTVTSCNTGVATVLPASDAPQVRTAFLVKGVAFNATPVCILATASGFTDTMLVSTVPFSLAITGGPDSITSGTAALFTFVYKDAKGVTLVGVTNPTFDTGDTTIAKATATPATVAGRAPGLTVVTATGPGGVAGTRNLKVVPAAFTGTTSSPVPGAFLYIRRASPADPAFDANTAVDVGAVDTVYAPDSLRVRVGDTAVPGVTSFTITGLGAADIADTGSYTVAAPAAFAGTLTPSPVFPGATVWIHRAGGDPVFDLKTMAFRGTIPDSNFAALTVDTSTVRPDSFKVTISDVSAANTYFFQFTRLGANLVAERGSYVLPVGTWSGTLTPSSAGPTAKVVLKQTGIGFDADTRVYFAGIRAFVDSVTTDSAVVVIPPFGSTGTKSLRVSRIGASQTAVDGASVLTSSTPTVLDAFDHGNDQVVTPTTIAGNGKYYMTLSGSCVGTGVGGVASKGSDDCDDYYKITNNSSQDTVTISVTWFTSSTDLDLYICDGTKLSDPPPNNIPSCGTVTGFDDDIGDSAGSSNPETVTGLEVAPNQTIIIWVNAFALGASGVLAKLTVSGFKP